MQINNNYSVLTPVASGADVTTSGYIVTITGVPPIDTRQVQNLGAGYVMFPFTERGGQWTVTFPGSPTASATYGFRVTQVSPTIVPALFGVPPVPASNQVIAENLHTTITGETQTQLSAAMTKGLNSYINPNVGLQVANTNPSASTQVIKANAGAPNLNVQDRSTPPAALTYSEILSATHAVSASTNDTPTVLTIATVQTAITAGALATGNFYPIIVGGTVTAGSGVTAGNFIGKLLTATTVGLYNLDGTSVAGSATSEISATVQFPIATSLGTYNDLIAAGVSASLLTTGHVYGIFQINFSQVESGGNDFPKLSFSWTVYVDYTANTTYYASFVTAIATAFGSGLYVL